MKNAFVFEEAGKRYLHFYPNLLADGCPHSNATI
jgi:hypothetical protein